MGQLDIVVNNAAEQNWHDLLEEITNEELASSTSIVSRSSALRARP
jgi:hypothetical protein